MNNTYMRQAIAKAYAGSISWQLKVSNMPDDRVTAIYYDFAKRGKFADMEDKIRAQNDLVKATAKIKENIKPVPEQISFFDLYEDL